MLDQMLQKKGQEVDRVLDFQVPDGLLVSEAAGLAHAGMPGPEWAVVLSLSVWRFKLWRCVSLHAEVGFVQRPGSTAEPEPQQKDIGNQGSSSTLRWMPL